MDRSRSAIGAVVVALLVALAGTAILPATTTAEAPANDEFQRTWQRTDAPIRDLVISRTWIWGPEAFTTGILEPYADAPNGQRMVQYFDKSRMEITTDPNVEPDSVWYVVNGLLATELITGELQLGHEVFESHEPAQINIAGDPEDTNAPTYASFSGLLDEPAFEVGTTIAATIDRAGQVGADEAMLGHGVTAGVYIQETDHTIADVFWSFMISEGTIYENGVQSYGALFEDAFFATGFPITEAYWTTVLVAGEPQDVLVQAFERRVLTYTPSNPGGWEVEAGNVGRHYHDWRYSITPAEEEPDTPAPPAPTPPSVPSVPTEPTPPVVNVPEADRGEVGEPGNAPLGPDEFSEHSEPYLAVPVGDPDEIGHTVTGQPPTATLNQSKDISLVNVSQSPSGKLYYVVDFNDGTIHVTPVLDANYGIKVEHTWLARGTYYGKAWSIDPITGIRTEVTEFVVTVS